MLSVGGDGVTLTINAQERVSVYFQACEAMMQYGDGGILLVGADGAELPVNPEEWLGGTLAVQQIVERLPATVAVPLPGEKTVTAIRVPQTKARGGLGMAGIPIDRWIGLFVFVAVAVALLAFAFYGSRSSIGSTPPLVSLVVWAALGYRLLRRLRF